MTRLLSLLAGALVLVACSQPVDPTVPDDPTGALVSPEAPTGEEPTSTTPPAAPDVTTAPTETADAGDTDAVRLALQPVATGLRAPLLVTAPPGINRLVVVEQPGRVLVSDGDGFVTLLDLRDRVTAGGERGLLGLAFHPDEPRVFVHYSGRDGRTTLSEFALTDDDPLAVEPGSERVLLTVEQPAANHNGGTVTFGPDGMLYLGLGDGGAAGDRFGNGQDPGTLLGTILRLDVSEPGAYGIPPDNPFVDGGGAPEVWLYGLRNPWRFDVDGDDVYIADVGQSAVEEIDVVTTAQGGANLGWPILEGSRCFQRDDCDRGGLVPPVHEYTQRDTGGCAIIGGEVYRGDAIPGLRGHYLFGDLCAGFVRSIRVEDGAVVDERDWTPQLGRVDGLLSFGSDAAGELYVTTQDGRVLKIVPTDA